MMVIRFSCIKTELVKRKQRSKSDEPKSAIKNITTLYKSREKVIKLFNDYSKIAYMTKYRTFYGERIKILTPK